MVAVPGEITASFRLGNIIMAIDDKPLDELIRSWTPYIFLTFWRVGAAHHEALVRCY
jgi:hypothetical protein